MSFLSIPRVKELKAHYNYKAEILKIEITCEESQNCKKNLED